MKRQPASTSEPDAGATGTAAQPARKVRFKLPFIEAHEVFLAGTFNEWHPAMFPMIESKTGAWFKDLLLPPGVYEYLFVADGRWISDPGNPRNIPNPFGGVNSVLEIVAARTPKKSK
jgi:1,4-alpha-glucan branching enzyme